jgi:hypothetical protein
MGIELREIKKNTANPWYCVSGTARGHRGEIPRTTNHHSKQQVSHIFRSRRHDGSFTLLSGRRPLAEKKVDNQKDDVACCGSSYSRWAKVTLINENETSDEKGTGKARPEILKKFRSGLEKLLNRSLRPQNRQIWCDANED